MRGTNAMLDALKLSCWLMGILSLGTWSSLTFGQEWARTMFEKTEHDFGIVPRGAKSDFEFALTNKYKEPVHIASVRSSCGCTSPKIAKTDLKTYEQGAVVAEFNTHSFIGQKSAVVTVVFDRPFYAEVQLIVKGNIRSDIVTDPGEVQFGEVDRGASKNTVVKVSHSGSSQWQITDVRSANPHLAVKLSQASGTQGNIEYSMQVRIKEDAPAGEFADEIVIVTNEKQYNQVTLPVRANIVPPLVVAPESIDLGSIQPKTKVQNRLIVKAKKPFSVKKITCPDDRFTISAPAGEKTVHIIPILFDSGEKIGGFREKITIETTLPSDSTVLATVSGNVAP